MRLALPSRRPATRRVVGIGTLGYGSHESSCGAGASYAVDVAVVDANSGASICDAVVTVTDGAYVEQATVYGQAPSCEYLAGAERPGTYNIHVAHPGYAPSDVNGVVANGFDCGVYGQSVTVRLQLL